MQNNSYYNEVLTEHNMRPLHMQVLVWRELIQVAEMI